MNEGKPTLSDMEIIDHENDTLRPHVVVDGRNGDVLERFENDSVAEAMKLALEIVDDAARIRDSIKTEQALGHMPDSTEEFSKRYRELTMKLRKAGYR